MRIDATGYSAPRSHSATGDHASTSHPRSKALNSEMSLTPLDRMRTGKRNRHRRPDSPDPNPKSKRDDISINQLT
ncbi:hypothetical protein EVAR_28025_1 [Eumeta japonica]|uniref:Uncharacterized protein n=1 Tax=Eumeta variegata TaxID=151549 RepID=A0A4C1WDX2_EUMVA|nr:hypothetical protein EVAR_28025_1 [Eumeta japonica]